MSKTKNNPVKKDNEPARKPKTLLLGSIAAVAIGIIAIAIFTTRSEKGQPSISNEPSAKDNVPALPTTAVAAKDTVLVVPTKAVAAKDEDLVIPVNEITEKASFFPVEMEGVNLEVLAVKAPDGTIRTAFNTCQVCFASGRGHYKQDGDVLVCQNCGNRFHMSDVEVTRGGCNPVPITGDEKIVDEDSITIPKEFLTEATVIFENWKN